MSESWVHMKGGLVHTTPSHVALDTTGTLNVRGYHLGERTFQVVDP